MSNILLSVLLSVGLMNQQAVPDSIKTKEIKEVTVYSITNKNLYLPVVSVDKKTLGSHDFFTAADALKNETGLALYRDGSWATSINVRGLSEQRLLILSDGDRLQTATDIAGTLSSVDLTGLEKIEVIKGAGSVLYGSGAMGGVVNFIPFRAGYSDQFRTFGNVSTGYQTVNHLWASSASANLSDKNWYLSVNGSFRTAGNTDTPKGVISNSQFHDAGVGVTGGMTYGDNQEFLIGFNHFEAWNVGLPGSNVFPASAVVSYHQFVRNQMNGEYIFKDISDVFKEFRIRAYTQNISRDVDNSVNATTKIYPSSKNTTSGIKTTAELYYNDYNKVTLGAEFWDRTSETSRIKVSLGSDTILVGEQPTPNARMYDAGVFALYKLVVDPKYFSMNFGLRGDYTRTANDTAYSQIFKYSLSDGERTNLPFTKTVLFLPEKQNQLSYAAHVDMNYTPTVSQQVGFSLASSYRVPSIEERFKYIDQSGTLRVGNPLLKPEAGLVGNLSYSYLKKHFFVKANVYSNYMMNLIAEKLGTFYRGDGAAVTALINTNIDKAWFRGAELEAQWLVTSQLKASANASYVKATDITTGDFLPQIPPAHGRADVTYSVENAGEITLAAVWAATQSEIASGETETPGYVVWNVDVKTIGVKAGKTNLQFFGGVENVFDKAYKNHLFSTRGLDMYEPGRNFFAKVRCSW